MIKDIPYEGDVNLLFGKIFPKRCMKMKEIELRGGMRPWCPHPDPRVTLNSFS